MHGYQLSRELGDSLGGFWRVSLRLALPHPAAPRARGRRRERSRRRGAERAPQERLPDHREGREAVLRAAPGDAARQLDRGHAVPRAPRVLQVPAARDAHPPAGTPARVPGGPALHHQGLAPRHARAGRRLHARADGARAERDRVRHRVARRPDRGRAPPHGNAPRGARSAGTQRRFAGRSAPHEQGSSRDRRRGQLRLVAGAGTRVLQGRRSARTACPG